MVKRLIFFVLLASIFWGCKEEMDFPFPKDFPVVRTHDYTRIGNDQVILKGNVIIPAYLSKTNSYFEYGFIASSKWYSDTLITGTTDQSTNFDQIFTKRHINNTSVEVVAFARHDSLVYRGNSITIDFTGQNFSISQVVPNKAIWQDTVMIIGSRLDAYKDASKVFFVIPWQNQPSNSDRAQIIEIDHNYIKVVVPKIVNAGPRDVVVTIASETVRIKDQFEIAKPEITGFEPEYGFKGDTITITGNYFGHTFDTGDNSNKRVSFAGRILPVVSWSNSQIKVILDNIPLRQENHFIVRYMNNDGPSQNTFHFINPWRLRAYGPSLSGARGFSINNMGIIGHNTFGKYNPITNSWRWLPGISLATTHPSPLVINNRAFLVNSTIGIVPTRYNIYEFVPEGNSGQWNLMGTKTLPNYFTTGHSSVVIQNRGFLRTSSSQDPSATNFFEIDPINNIWTPAPQYPGGTIRYDFSMEINGMAYFGAGRKNNNLTGQFFRYDPISQAWTQLANFPVESRLAIGFSLDGVGYAGLGNKNLEGDNFDRALYAYDPELDTWKWVAEFPLVTSNNQLYNPYVFTIGNVAYIGSSQFINNNFFEFDPAYLRENYQHNTQKTKPE